MAVWAAGGGLFLEVNAEAAAPADYSVVSPTLVLNCGDVISMAPATARSRSWLPERDSLYRHACHYQPMDTDELP